MVSSKIGMHTLEFFSDINMKNNSGLIISCIHRIPSIHSFHGNYCKIDEKLEKMFAMLIILSGSDRQQQFYTAADETVGDSTHHLGG